MSINKNERIGEKGCHVLKELLIKLHPRKTTPKPEPHPQRSIYHHRLVHAKRKVINAMFRTYEPFCL